MPHDAANVCSHRMHHAALKVIKHVKQGVAVTGRNGTGPRHGVLQTTTDNDDRRQRASLVWPPTQCVGGPVISRVCLHRMRSVVLCCVVVPHGITWQRNESGVNEPLGCIECATLSWIIVIFTRTLNIYVVCILFCIWKVRFSVVVETLTVLTCYLRRSLFLCLFVSRITINVHEI